MFSSFSLKKHKYETQSDLKDLTPEQIVSLSPNEVGFYIKDRVGDTPLDINQQKALTRLLLIKKQHKKFPSEKARQNAISSFMGNQSNEANELIVETTNEIMTQQLEQKKLENRLRRLNNQEIIPFTEDENQYIRLNNLNVTDNTGGKKYKKRKSKRTKYIKNKGSKSKKNKGSKSKKNKGSKYVKN